MNVFFFDRELLAAHRQEMDSSSSLGGHGNGSVVRFSFHPIFIEDPGGSSSNLVSVGRRRRSLSLLDGGVQFVVESGVAESRGRGHGLGFGNWLSAAAASSMEAKALMKGIPASERACIGALAGGLAGAITYTFLHPIDTIKTKLQTRGASALYSGTFDAIVKTFHTDGLPGFYRGISAVLVGSAFSSSVYFGTCELGKATLSTIPTCPPLIIPPLAGAMGNLISSAILVPKEVITQRMQAGAAGRSWQVALRTLKKEGIVGLYAGYSAALVRNLPSSVLSFSAFEYLKAAWLSATGSKSLEPWQSFTCGAIAGVFSAALTTPLDVVKTRLMTQARKTSAEAILEAKLTASTYRGISSTIRQIWVEEGWRGLTTGMGPRLLHSAFFYALGYFVFETARLALIKHHVSNREKTQKLHGIPV